VRVALKDYDASRIALIKPSALGDVVQSLPVLTALRHRFPNAHIAWVINRGYEPLLVDHPDLNETLPFNRRPGRESGVRALAEFAVLLRAIRRKQFDLVVDLQGLARTGLMTVASGAPRRVGLSTAREGARWSYTDVVHVPDIDTIHAVDRYWLIAEALGVSSISKQFRLPIADTANAWAVEELNQCPHPWMAFGVGSRWITKRWPALHFAELAAKAQAQFGGTVIFVGGPDETAPAQVIAEHLIGPVRDFTGKTTLPQLAALLAIVDVMVANDTGPLHLAAALGRPVLAPYTCTKVIRSGPYGALSSAVETGVWCRGSYLKQCDRLDCMTELSPGRLWPRLEEHLRIWQRQRQSA
jgi:lipopolysaccharide heptosyltransferase I